MPSRLLSLFARPRGVGDSAAAAARTVDEVGVPRASELAPRPRSLAAMRRERRQLLRLREVEIRDIGGLAFEMVRRDRFRESLLRSRCAEVLALEERIRQLDALLAAETVARASPQVERCTCGAPIVRGAHFCSHCGRPATETPPILACNHCGTPLPAAANFCAVCGNAVAAEDFERERAGETVLPPPAAGES